MNFLPFDFIGKTFGEERCVPEYGDPTNFEPGLLVDGGICYIQFLKKLFIPCYARTENVRKTLCTTQGLSDPAQRCREKRKKRKCKKRKDCALQKPPEPKLMCPRTPLSDMSRCSPKRPEPPPEPTPPAEPTPPPQQPKKIKEEIKCPHCSKPTTIIICDSCNKCHKIECGSK